MHSKGYVNRTALQTVRSEEARQFLQEFNRGREPRLIIDNQLVELFQPVEFQLDRQNIVLPLGYYTAPIDFQCGAVCVYYDRFQDAALLRVAPK